MIQSVETGASGVPWENAEGLVAGQGTFAVFNVRSQEAYSLDFVGISMLIISITGAETGHTSVAHYLSAIRPNFSFCSNPEYDISRN